MTNSKKVESLLSGLDQIGWETGLSNAWLRQICELPIRGDSFLLAAIAAELVYDHQPITLRGLFYRVVSMGFFPNTDKAHYSKLGNLMSRLRRERVIPYSWVVDNIRSTIKPSSWAGLDSFADTVRDAYRKNFWSSLPVYTHVFVEKDAMSGVIDPVTRELDVPLSPVRGYISDSYAHEIGKRWKRISKPIMAFYLGDFDPSGFDLERSLREKLEDHSEKSIDGNAINWSRLALNEPDLNEFKLHTMKCKRKNGKLTDSRAPAFIAKYGDRCAEVDALDPNIIRGRVRDAIMQHVDQDQWEKLKEVEAIERETWESTLGSIGGAS